MFTTTSPDPLLVTLDTSSSDSEAHLSDSTNEKNPPKKFRLGCVTSSSSGSSNNDSDSDTGGSSSLAYLEDPFIIDDNTLANRFLAALGKLRAEFSSTTGTSTDTTSRPRPSRSRSRGRNKVVVGGLVIAREGKHYADLPLETDSDNNSEMFFTSSKTAGGSSSRGGSSNHARMSLKKGSYMMSKGTSSCLRSDHLDLIDGDSDFDRLYPLRSKKPPVTKVSSSVTTGTGGLRGHVGSATTSSNNNVESDEEEEDGEYDGSVDTDDPALMNTWATCQESTIFQMCCPCFGGKTARTTSTPSFNLGEFYGSFGFGKGISTEVGRIPELLGYLGGAPGDGSVSPSPDDNIQSPLNSIDSRVW